MNDIDFLLGSGDFDIIGVSETWLNEKIPTSLLIKSYPYSAFRKDRSEGRGGGVALFFKKTLTMNNLKLPDEFWDTEIIVCDIFDKFQSKTRIILCYRPPNISEEDDVKLSNCLKWAINTQCKTVIIGDFNLPNINYFRADQIIQKTLLDTGFKQIVDKPTRDENILDLIFVSSPFLIFDLFIDPPFSTSDHNMIKFKLHFLNESISHKKSIDFKNLDYNSLKHYLAFIEWPIVFNHCVTVDDFYNTFLKIIFDAVNLFTQNYPKIERKSTMPLKLRKLLNKKKQIWHYYKLNRTSENCLKYKSICKKVKRFQKSLLISKEVKLLKNNSINLFYKFVNNRLNQKQSIPPIYNNGSLHISSETKASIFNNYFASVFTKDNGISPVITTDHQTDLHISFDLASVDLAVKKLNSTFSIGPDGLCAYFFKQLSEVIIFPLQTIFEVSYRTGTLPHYWKSANIVPVFKKGDPSLAENYRPISLTCASSRIMESIINQKLVSYLTDNKIISNCQFGFLKNKSCTFQLLHCKNRWTKSLDLGHFIDIIYLDISKAFDSVSHSKLLIKLKALGFNNFLYDWLKNFLFNRTQKVKIDHFFSDPKPVKSGVPQGSVLGPTLFLIYINDLPSNLRSDILLFADDAKIFNFSENHLIIQEDLEKINEWCNIWQLKIAINKCNVLYLGKNNPRHVYTINNQNVLPVSEIKDLGVMINEKLSSSAQCSVITKKARMISGLIFKSFVSRDQSLLLKAYKTYVRPILEYATVIWNPFKIQDIKSVEKVQRHFTKRMFPNRNITYEERLAVLNLEKLEKRRLLFDLSMAYEITNLHCLPPEDFFTFNTNKTRSTNSMKMMINFSQNNFRKYDFCNRVIKLWNVLPETILRAPSKSKFFEKICDFNFNDISNV